MEAGWEAEMEARRDGEERKVEVLFSFFFSTSQFPVFFFF
jgi:hypothetical protein